MDSHWIPACSSADMDFQEFTPPQTILPEPSQSRFSEIDRRNFFGAVAAGTLLAAEASAALPVPFPMETRKGDMLYRSFGKTGETVSVPGVGGSHIGKAESDALATKIIRTAIDRGVNFMDNAWDYR